VLADIVEGFVVANVKLAQDAEIRNMLWDCIASNNLQKTDFEFSENHAISSAA
jgi:hypothetical protein